MTIISTGYSVTSLSPNDSALSLSITGKHDENVPPLTISANPSLMKTGIVLNKFKETMQIPPVGRKNILTDEQREQINARRRASYRKKRDMLIPTEKLTAHTQTSKSKLRLWDSRQTASLRLSILRNCLQCDNNSDFFQLQKCKEDDRISKLPNDILVNILDRLDFRDVTRTSVLSRRLSQLPANLSRLQISACDFLSPQTSISDDKLDRKLVRTNALRRINAVNAANAAVVKATKSMLAHRDPGGCTIRLLSTTFYLRGDTPISIGHTVGNAMATLKVEKAEFSVLTEKEECEIDDLVNYGTRFVSFFNECHNAFAGLTRLYLENLRFRESDFVSNILVTCKQLNYLGFFNCDTEDWITLEVEHAQLSDLSIVNCCFDMVKLTWVPKLTWLALEIVGSPQEPPLVLGYVPLLGVLRLLNITRKMVKLSTFLRETSVQDLTLGFKCEKIWVQPECLTRRQAYVFQQLRFLNLDKIPEGYDLTWTMFFLEAAPSLEELYMMVCSYS
ncbi:uncharacterized protein LOC123405902 [Hordeum vulgare subsp. vulgare]|uniref:uncharacterized protein LOC123405902 n=1 Tax=Hordeum vulgare subsp. vulgare TaxID=112509 RepID=UPI001D1A5810|nr:uncharacterized protein LOC123405902 [Hordeum vulgare subsp. vulgare]